MWVQSLDRKDPLEEGTAAHSSILAWRVPMDRGSWWATVHSIGKSWTRLKRLSLYAQEIKIRLLFYMKGKIFQLIPSLLSVNLILTCVLLCT